MEQLKFIKNYNQKLFCDAFTTIRPFKRTRRVGDEVKIILFREGKDPLEMNATIRHLHTTYLRDIPEYTFATDTGMGKELSIEMFQNIYNKIGIDANAIQFQIITLTHR